MQSAGHSNVKVASVYGKGWFETGSLHSHKQVVRRTQHFERLVLFFVDWKSERLC